MLKPNIRSIGINSLLVPIITEDKKIIFRPVNIIFPSDRFLIGIDGHQQEKKFTAPANNLPHPGHDIICNCFNLLGTDIFLPVFGQAITKPTECPLAINGFHDVKCINDEEANLWLQNPINQVTMEMIKDLYLYKAEELKAFMSSLNYEEQLIATKTCDEFGQTENICGHGFDIYIECTNLFIKS